MLAACGAPSPPAKPLDPAAIDSRWVQVYDPARAFPGYTLTLHRARTPVLLDLNGREVHRWAAARVKSRVRLLPDGGLLAIGLGRQVVELDWEGRVRWSFETPEAIPHHDVVRLANGNTLVVILPAGDTADTLLEVDRAGKVVWTWRALDHLGALLPASPRQPHDLTHVNSVAELPENPWFAAGDGRFRPGNLLLSARNLSTVFVVERASGEIVWSHAAGLDLQHEALMTPPGFPEPGRVMLFNNRARSFSGDRQSEVLELDPRDGAVSWRYRAPGFFSPTGGTQQLLPNGNVLVTSTRGGRLFEVTREGATVWEWAPPYQPGRALRVALDACPQLAALPPPRLRAVPAAPETRHVDHDAYRFARRGARGKVVVEGEERVVLTRPNECRRLLLPGEAELAAAWGVDRSRRAAVGQGGAATTFVLTLRPEGAAAPVELLRDSVGAEDPAWRRRTLSLAEHAFRTVELCVGIEGPPAAGGGAGERWAFWEQPLVTGPRDRERAAAAGEDEEGDGGPGDLTPEELEVRRQHLRSLGYAG